MNLRTDLAMEVVFGDRVTVSEEDGCRVTRLEIDDETAARTGKQRGKYVTIDVAPFGDCVDDDHCRTVVSRELRSMLPESGDVLVAGLGNEDITPDALGPRTVSRVLATRHITGELEKLTGHRYFRTVAAVRPDVLGNTGVEAAETLQSLVSYLKPAVVIVIDALAARSLDRLGCTVQLCDGGLSPGSGVGNHRPAINKATLGVSVIAVGVPTVVDGATLAADLAPKIAFDDIAPHGAQMMVTPRNIDEMIRRASHLIAMAVNTAINPFFSAEEYEALIL